MAKTSLEKAIEKQQREEKRIAEQSARRDHASTIVNGQPIIGHIKIMDSAAEETLEAILSVYDGSANMYVQGDASNIPEQYYDSLSLQFEKLVMYGMITSPQRTLSGNWWLNLTPQALSYFEDKEKALEEEKQRPKRLVAKQYDVFISHANKDKLDYVDTLYLALRKLGVSIFYDTDCISWGDSIKTSILEGTASSEFAIIVISENFFDREWTEKELSEFLKRQNESGQKIVLPLLHGITIEKLVEKYPELGDIKAIQTATHSVEDIVILFAKELVKRLKQ